MNAYRMVFQSYLLAGLQQTTVQIQSATPLVPDGVRQQAWHLLSYAFKDQTVWLATRELLLALAPKMEQAGHYTEWIAYLEGGVRQSEQCGDEIAAAECQLHIGHLHRLQHHYEQARAWLAASAARFAALACGPGQARALNQLAYVAWREHRYAEANALADQALGLLGATDPECAMSLSAKGLVAFAQHRWAAAEEHHRRALMVRQQEGDERRIAWSLQNLGNTLRAQERYPAAIAAFGEALELLSRVHDPINQAIVELNLGIVYYSRGQYAEALQCYARVEAHYSALNDRLNRAKLLNNRGLCYLALHDWPAAEASFRHSIALFEELGDLGERLNAMDGLGMVYLQQGRYAQAETLLRAALAALPQLSDHPDYAFLLADLSGHLQEAAQGDSHLGGQGAALPSTATL
jgi:tetratricopeptide (TPR) repeat protein